MSLADAISLQKRPLDPPILVVTESASTMVLLLEPADQPVGLFSQRYLHGVWIPTGFIIAAVAAIKPAYSPYAAVVGLLIIAWRFQEMSEFNCTQAPL